MTQQRDGLERTGQGAWTLGEQGLTDVMGAQGAQSQAAMDLFNQWSQPQQGPSPAELQMMQALQRGQASQQSMALSNPSMNPAIAQRMAAQQSADIHQGGAQQFAMMRAMEEQQRRQQQLAALQASGQMQQGQQTLMANLMQGNMGAMNQYNMMTEQHRLASQITPNQIAGGMFQMGGAATTAAAMSDVKTKTRFASPKTQNAQLLAAVRKSKEYSYKPGYGQSEQERYIGPMANDLPSSMVQEVNGVKMVDAGRFALSLGSVVGQQAEELERLKKAIQKTIERKKKRG